jgi:polysaccharide pyruvyl transferase WcaK-like protein
MKRHLTRQKIVPFGNFGTGNPGNEATLEAIYVILEDICRTRKSAAFV